ncbi:transcription repressor NadR [Facklamia sp. 7083-14-GEN3]|uniref:transcription repressor NadR n=1 Tax=Facklamia sp. 7083-14-GEN3 TaxID=2973478 RepID=UPI00215BC343|nr:transcription repressor NadR [Facklamia sp. 7083-14-GEN3]MCR8969586.1 transcription repressor NadR [Facklamia sp. 7083-14-GEN3]
MKAQERRQAILAFLKEQSEAVTANELASRYQVSRQVIVGDIALLRAHYKVEILATNQGYLIPTLSNVDASRQGYTGVIVCRHDDSKMRVELETILAHQGKILDVQIEHPVYGLLSAALHINNQADLEAFLDRMAAFDGEMLASLTNGIHSHTIQVPSLKEFDQIQKVLEDEEILYI